MKTKKRNCTQLREDIDALHQRLLSGEDVDLESAKVANNAAGKILTSAKIQLMYAKMRREQPDISFLD